MVGQHRGGQEEKRKVTSLRGFYGPKQSMLKGPVPHALNRLAGGRHSRPSSDEFLGRLSGLPLNIAGLEGSGEDNLCDTYWELSLQSNAVWPKECRFHLSKDDD